MVVYANYRIGRFSEAILAADRFLAIYPNGKDVAYVLYLKGNSYFGQIKDITRDQQLSRDAIDTYNLIISNYPKSEYAQTPRKSCWLPLTSSLARKCRLAAIIWAMANIWPASTASVRLSSSTRLRLTSKRRCIA